MAVRDLKAGTIVRALQDLDPEGAAVRKGDVGVVFGDANCYGDNAGPIVRWFHVHEDETGFPLHTVDMAGTCNVYDDQVEVLLRPENDFLQRIDHRYFAHILAQAMHVELEAEEWGDIKPEWFGQAFVLDDCEDQDLLHAVGCLEQLLLKVAYRLRGAVPEGKIKWRAPGPGR